MDVNTFLNELTERFPQASDFVINPFELVVISSKQVVHKERGEFSPLVEQVLFEKEATGRKDLDTSWKVNEGLRFRLNVARYDGDKYELTFRWLRDVKWKFTDYGIDEKIARQIKERVETRKGGLFMVIGPTGSGKSTVMASLLSWLLESLPIRVVTIEDPVEYRLKEGKGSVLQREVGSDTESFNRALKSALRQNPNVIFVGEVRDRETVKLLFEAADTGHTVFATMHTDTPKDTIERFLGMVDTEEHEFLTRMIAKTLIGVLGLRMYDYRGGKLMLYEFMNGQDPAVKGVVLQKNFQSLKTFTNNVEAGHVPFEYSFAELAKKGKVELEDYEAFGLDRTLVYTFLTKV